MVSFPDHTDALRRAEWECFAVELRANAEALFATLDDEDEIATRRALLEMALLNPVDHQFEIDTELFHESGESSEAEGKTTAEALRGLDDDVDESRG